jgi:sestrin 1/3
VNCAFAVLEVNGAAAPKLSPVWGGSISRFVDDPSFTYQDFCRRGEKSTILTFRNRDFSWEDYGYSLAERLYNDNGAALLDEKFALAQNLTYNT